MHKSKILVVDDELPVCRSMASALAKEDYIIDMALSGEEAITKDETVNYDVVITDLMMPGISGMELLQVLKKRRPDVMVIMVTGYPSIKSAIQATKSGAFDFIPKPFTPDELRSLVSRALEQKPLLERELRGSREEKEIIPEVSIPEGLYSISNNSWVTVEQDGNVRVGVHHMLLMSIGKIASIQFPKEQEMRYQGEVCLIINDTQNRIHRVWTPVSGRIIAINDEIEKDYHRLIREPYRSWVLLMTPTALGDEMKNLTPLRPHKNA